MPQEVNKGSTRRPPERKKAAVSGPPFPEVPRMETPLITEWIHPAISAASTQPLCAGTDGAVSEAWHEA
jgi:hypothetical protein